MQIDVETDIGFCSLLKGIKDKLLFLGRLLKGVFGERERYEKVGYGLEANVDRFEALVC